MKIVKVECIPVSSPMKKPIIMPNTRITAIDSLIVKITADDGTVGIADSGDTSSWYRGELQDTMISMICDVIAPRILMGEDPRKIEKIVGLMDLLVRDNNQAKAVIDFALHDLIKGKTLGVPVFEQLGVRTIEAARKSWVLSVMCGCMVGSGLEHSALNMPHFKGGLSWPNEGPGFGIDVNEEFLVRNHTKGKHARSVSL